jgi:hypothetical protein
MPPRRCHCNVWYLREFIRMIYYRIIYDKSPIV